MKISNDVANVLGNCDIKDTILFLPEGQLDRKLYVSVDKVLKAIGGKWNRGAKGHIFKVSPVDVIDNILITGEYIDAKKEYQFFETPDSLAKQIVELAGIKEGESVLEPSAGKGRIAKHIKNCNCIELNPENRGYLIENGFNVVGEDFLYYITNYDVIVANPPFTKQQDIDHINHMIDLANRKVVSIASSSVMFRDNKKTVEFRNRIEELGGTITPLPENTFVESGTKVNTCIVEVTK